MRNFRRLVLGLLLVSLALGLTVFAHANFDLDIDDDGKTEALTDGLLVIRHLFGFSGDSLTANATSKDANRSDAASIEAYLVDNKSSLDVDGDGSVEALTDGLLIIRELFGFSDDSLITGAVSGSGTRVTVDSVVDYLKTIKDTDDDGYRDSVDAFVTEASEWLDTDSDGIGDNADPFPSIASTANPNASTTRLVSEGFNQPKTNPEQWQIFSTNTSSYYIDRAKKVQGLLNQSFGGYMNYNLLVYEEEGPDEANQPVIDRLVALGYRGKEGWTTEEMERSCLDGASAGNKQAGDWVFHSICLWFNSQWFNAPSNPPADFSKPAGVLEYDITGAMANEYFHHYQRVHGLDRGMDYQFNWGGDPYVTVNAPYWWVQGTAMIIQTWWQRGILDELQYLSDEDRARFKESIDGRMEMHNSRYWMGLQMMQSSEPWINLQGDNDEQRFGASNCSNWLLAKKHYAYPDDMEGGEDCIAYDEMHIVPVHFMAYKSSWETVLKKIPESYYEYGFWGAVEIHLGLKEQEFYDEFNTFMRAQDWKTIEVFYAPEGWNVPDGRIEELVNFSDIYPYDGQ